MSITSRLPPNAPTGSPPPMIFPRTGRAGGMPNISFAPPKATPEPGVTPSHTKKDPPPRDARGARLPEGEPPRTGLDQHRVGVAVVAPLELHDLVPSRYAPRQPDGAHRRLGPRGNQPYLPDRGGCLDDDAGRTAVPRPGCPAPRPHAPDGRVAPPRDQFFPLPEQLPRYCRFHPDPLLPAAAGLFLRMANCIRWPGGGARGASN